MYRLPAKSKANQGWQYGDISLTLTILNKCKASYKNNKCDI